MWANVALVQGMGNHILGISSLPLVHLLATVSLGYGTNVYQGASNCGNTNTGNTNCGNSGNVPKQTRVCEVRDLLVVSSEFDSIQFQLLFLT